MTKVTPGPAYRAETPRLIIRCWDPRDTELLKKAIDDSLDHLRPWMAWAQKEPEALQVKIERLREARGQFDLSQDFGYGIFTPGENLVLGGAGLHKRVGEGAREIGYWIHRDHINQGLATEAAAALTRVAFEIDKVKRVEIHCDPKNVRSAAIPQKLGFTHEATLHHRVEAVRGDFRDMMIWILFEGDYPTSPATQIEIRAFNVISQQIL